MPKLTKEQLSTQVQRLKQWIYEHDSLIRVFEFPHFRQSILFVQQVADLAEESNHHPDISIRYRRVTIILTSHDEQSLTERDIIMAEKIENLYENK
jgi:4a-hydroxytetrahydrobiopterin dehydratase